MNNEGRAGRLRNPEVLSFKKSRGFYGFPWLTLCVWQGRVPQARGKVIP